MQNGSQPFQAALEAPQAAVTLQPGTTQRTIPTRQLGFARLGALQLAAAPNFENSLFFPTYLNGDEDSESIDSDETSYEQHFPGSPMSEAKTASPKHKPMPKITKSTQRQRKVHASMESNVANNGLARKGGKKTLLPLCASSFSASVGRIASPADEPADVTPEIFEANNASINEVLDQNEIALEQKRMS